MDMQQIGTKLTLEALGIPLCVNTFDDRLVIQKAIYLAKAAGFDCGHYFRWYLRGPYSPELTRDVFSIQAELKAGMDDSTGWTLSEEDQAQLQRLKPLVPGAWTKKNARQLEILASVHFVVSRGQASGTDAKSLANSLTEFGKDFTDEEVAEALNKLREHEYLSSE